MKTHKIFSIILGVLISITAIYAFFWGVDIKIFSFNIKFEKVDFSSIYTTLKSINIYYFILAFIFSQITFIFRAIRLWLILKSIKENVSLWDSIIFTILGFGGNNILPLRGGEALKAFSIYKKTGISFVSATNSVIIERIYDTINLGIFILFILFFMNISENKFLAKYFIDLKEFAIYASLFFIFLFIFLLSIDKIEFFKRKKSNKIIIEVLRFKHMILPNFNLFVFMILITILLWFSLDLGIYFLFKAFHMNLSIIAGVLLETLLSVSVALPSTPGFLGVFQVAVELILKTFSISISTSTIKSFAILLWIVQIIPITFLFIITISLLPEYLSKDFNNEI